MPRQPRLEPRPGRLAAQEPQEPGLAPQRPARRPRRRDPRRQQPRRRRARAAAARTTTRSVRRVTPRWSWPPRAATSRAAIRRGSPASAPTRPTLRPASRGHDFDLAPARRPAGRLRRRLLRHRCRLRGRRLALALRRGLGLRQALLQRIHQVHHVAALRRRRDDRLVALQLLLDHRHQRGLVAILVGLGIELRRLLRDQRLGELQHLGVRLHVGDLVEIGRGGAHLVRRAQRADEHPLVARPDRHHPLPARQHQPRDGELARLAHRLAQHHEGLFGHRAVRRQIVGRVLVNHVDLGRVDEGLDVQRVVRLQPHRLEVAVVDDDVLLVLVLVALDQIRPLDQPELGIDRLHVDPVVGVLVQLVEAHPLVRARRRIEPHRAAHQAQFQITLPGSPRRHLVSPCRIMP